MPRAKKKTTTSTKVVEKNEVNEAVVARLCLDVLEVYKSNCTNDLAESGLTRDQQVKIAQNLDRQLQAIKPKCLDQVSLVFKD